MKQTHALPIFLLLVCYAILSSCSKKNSSPQPQYTGPAITSVSTTHGPYNTQLDINGVGLSPDGLAGVVKINGKNVPIVSWTNTKISVTIPVATGTGAVVVIVNGMTLNGGIFTYDYVATGSTLLTDGTFGVGTCWPYFSSTYGIAFDNAGNMYVSNSNLSNSKQNVVMQFLPATPSRGQWTPIGGGSTGVSVDGGLYSATFTFPAGMVNYGSSTTYVADVGEIRKIMINGEIITVNTVMGSTGAYNYTDIAMDKNGNLYATDMQNNVIREISSTGVMSVFAGNGVVGSDDGVGTAATFNQPVGITIDGKGNLFVTDEGSNLIRKITKDGFVSTIAGSGSKAWVDGMGNHASFNTPMGITIDGSGNLYVADYGNFAIREIQPDGTVSTIAGGAQQGASDGQNPSFSHPTGITIGPDGAFYITDGYRIRRLIIE